MTIQELYETIKKKKESAEKYKIATWNCINQNKWDKQAQEHYLEKEQRLIGEIEAYVDLMCLIESSGEIDDK
ncbi:MAG: hypothetical protein J6T10_06930 [Methanobrevibacter sp.]|nr:hypothetical protein [Methanobrevibacter sp.]